MRRHGTEQNLGEKRVFLGSLRKKTNLKSTYDRLDIEEKAFIASTNFKQKQLLSRQNKIRQLQTQPNKRLSLDTFPKPRTSFPGLSGNRESWMLDYSNNLTLPKSRHSLRSPREAKTVSPFPRKDSSEGIGEPRKHTSSLHDSTSEKWCKHKTPLKLKSDRVEQGGKLAQQSSEVHVVDILAYSASFGKKAKSRWRGTSLEQRDARNGGDNIASERIDENDNPTVRRPPIWKNTPYPASTDPHESKTSNFPEEKDVIINSTTVLPHSDKNLFDQPNLSNESKTGKRTPRVSPDMVTQKEGATNSQPKCDDFPKKPVQLKDSAGVIWGANSEVTKTSLLLDNYDNLDELASDSHNVCPSFTGTVESASANQSSQEEPFPTSRNIQYAETEEIERPNTTLPNLVSRRRSWIASETLPALGRIRRGSFCDVKTFKSGKVLDLLSSCEVPDLDKKDDGQHLDVENLKYCRYLRSVTPADATADSDLDFLIKYRPSKHIIIGHTKITPMQ